MAREQAVGNIVFPGRTGKSLVEIKKAFKAVCEAAGITNFRIHDLRHSFASMLASDGISLPVIGRLLGHTQASTTMRYSHLLDDPLREATQLVSNRLDKTGNRDGRRF
jgi:integrase